MATDYCTSTACMLAGANGSVEMEIPGAMYIMHIYFIRLLIYSNTLLANIAIKIVIIFYSLGLGLKVRNKVFDELGFDDIFI